MSPSVKKPGAASPGNLEADQQSSGSDAATVARTAVNRERARWHIVLGSIRAQLDEQPTRRMRIAAAKRWCSAILAMADEEAQS